MTSKVDIGERYYQDGTGRYKIVNKDTIQVEDFIDPIMRGLDSLYFNNSRK